MKHYKVCDLMVAKPLAIINPDSNLVEAAALMLKADCGILPVGTEDNLIGMLTDRDIVLRAISIGRDPVLTLVRDIMTPHAYSVFEDTTLDTAIETMNRHHAARLIVRDRKGQLSGLLSLSGLIRENADTQIIAKLVEKLVTRHHQKETHHHTQAA